MVEWILIAWMYSEEMGINDSAIDSTAVVVEFHTQEACQAAGEQLLAKRSRRSGNPVRGRWNDFVCVPKGKPTNAE